MASFTKLPSGKWRASIKANGLRKTKAFNTKPEAQQWAYETEQELKGGAAVVEGRTLADALQRYADEVSPSKKGARWEYVRAAALAKEDIGSQLLTTITRPVINEWIVARGKSVMASTVNRELNFLSAVFERCVTHWRWMSENPVKGCVRPKDPAPRDRRIASDEINRILQALDGYSVDQPALSQRHEIAMAFLFALETAMRQGEIWGLHWADVHLAQRFVRLRDTKNGTARDVPLSSAAVALLEKVGDYTGCRGRVFKSSQASAGTIFRRALQLAGVKGMTFHDTRHEALTRLARKLDVLDLARMVGHRDPRSLMIYYNATATEIAGRLG